MDTCPNFRQADQFEKGNTMVNKKSLAKYGALAAVVAAVTYAGFTHSFDPEIAVAESLIYKASKCRQEINEAQIDFGPKCTEYARFKTFLVGQRLVSKWTEELAIGSEDVPGLNKRTERVLVLDQVVASEQRLANKREACLNGAKLQGCSTVQELLPSYAEPKS